MTKVQLPASTSTPNPEDQRATAPTALYRLYSTGGTLLYIGITDDPQRRFKQHRDTKPWWPQVTQKTIEWHPNRHDALAAETAAIKAETPVHNIDHNPAAVSYHWPPAGMPTDRVDAIERQASTLPADQAEGIRRAAWEGFTRAQLANRASTPTSQHAAEARARLAELIDTPSPVALSAAEAEDRLTHLAGALFVANAVYTEALTASDPAAVLDCMCDTVHEVMPEVFRDMGTEPGLAAVLLPAAADRLWAYAVIEHARTDVDDDYRYLLDLLADGLKGGADPQTVRAEVPRVVKRIHSACTLHRIHEARHAADGPWAQILDIVLAEIDKGADPHAVLDQVLGLMAQVRDESKAAA